MARRKHRKTCRFGAEPASISAYTRAVRLAQSSRQSAMEGGCPAALEDLLAARAALEEGHGCAAPGQSLLARDALGAVRRSASRFADICIVRGMR